MRPHRRRRSFVPALLGLLALAAACADSPSGFAGRCARTADCETGLFCSDATTLVAGQCTVSCEHTSDCEREVGPRTFCARGNICLYTCDTEACPSGMTCEFAFAPNTCVND